MKNPIKWVGEMVMNWDVSRSAFFGPSFNALRGYFSEAFFSRPIASGTVINYDLARALYRNEHGDYKYGGGFVRPVIDRSVEYIGIPSVSGTNDDAFLNECITDYWAPQIQEAFRDAMRDSQVIVRYRQPNLSNPLMTERDRTHGRIEIIPPEEVDLTYDPSDPDLLIRAVVTHWINIDERSDEEVLNGTAPRETEHEILEIITPEDYRFFDKTTGSELASWRTANRWRFVPLWKIYNEYAADLGGGQSDIEPILPFVEAFHQVFSDVLAAHKYHSIPKVKFNLKSVEQFIRNNFPEAYDPDTNQIKKGAKVNLSGREIYFFNVDEEADFIEARSVLGDSKTLLEFLIECIAIAAEIPRWALLAEERAVQESDASVQPFSQKITRKRVQFNELIVMCSKMALKANNKIPNTPRVSWPPVRLLDLVTKGQAIQQLILGFDIAASHQWLADRTIVHILGTLFDEVSDPDEEMKAAKNNKEALPAPAPASDTQALPPSNGNGNGSKSAARQALATTSASRS